MPTEPAELFGYIAALIVSTILVLAIIAGGVLGLLWLGSRGGIIMERRRLRRAEAELRLAQIRNATRRAEEGERG